MWQARVQYSACGCRKTARVAADNALRFFVVLLGYFGAYHNTAWYLVTLLFMLAGRAARPHQRRDQQQPAQAGRARSAPRRFRSRRPSPAFWASAAMPAPPGSSSGRSRPSRRRYTARRAMPCLPAAADDTHWPLSAAQWRLRDGCRGGGRWRHAARPAPARSRLARASLGAGDWRRCSACVALVFVLPVRFASDVRRPGTASAAMRGFFTDARAVLVDRELRVCLLGLALLRAIVTGLTGALLPRVLTAEALTAEQIAAVIGWVIWIMAGLAVGSLVAGLVPHPRRVLGLVPLGALGLAIGLVLAAGTPSSSPALLCRARRHGGAHQRPAGVHLPGGPARRRPRQRHGGAQLRRLPRGRARPRRCLPCWPVRSPFARGPDAAAGRRGRPGGDCMPRGSSAGPRWSCRWRRCSRSCIASAPPGRGSMRFHAAGRCW